MPIRLPEVPGLQPTAINMPGLRIDAAAAQGEALVGVARDLAGVADAFHATAIQTQKLDNARRLSETRQNLAADYQNHLLELEKNPDPAARIQKTREFLELRKQALEGEDLPPAVRDQALAYFGDFANRAFIEQGAEAARLATKRAALAMQNELDAAKAHGDREGYSLALTTAQDAGAILPEQADAYLAEFERAQTATTLDLAIQEEPALVLQDLESPDFFQRMPGVSQEDLPRIRSAARASAQRHRSEQLDVIEAALEADKLNDRDIEVADYLTPGDVAKVRKALAMAQADRLPSNEDHAKAWGVLWDLREARNDPAMSQDRYRKLWNEARGSVLQQVAPKWQGDIKKELAYLSPAGRDPEATKVSGEYEKADLEAIGRNIAFRARDAGFFGKMDDDATPAEKEKAFRKAEDLRLEVKHYVRANPKATPAEVREFTDGRISGERVKSNVAELQQFIPGRRFRPAPTMPALPPKQGTKDRAAGGPLQIPAGPASASDALLPARQLEIFLNSDQ